MACAAGRGPGARVGTSAAQARRVSAQAFRPWSVRRPLMAIVMGLDQHRAQITAEWLDTDSGEVSSRSWMAPARPRGGAAVRWSASAGQRARGRAGGDDGLAVRRRGAAASRRGRCIWPSRRRPPPGAGTRSAPRTTAPTRGTARAGDDRTVAGVVDPARSHPRSARAGAAAALARRTARRVAAAHPGGALSPRAVPQRRQPDDRGRGGSGWPRRRCRRRRASRSRSRSR